MFRSALVVCAVTSRSRSPEFDSCYFEPFLGEPAVPNIVFRQLTLQKSSKEGNKTVAAVPVAMAGVNNLSLMTKNVSITHI